MEGLRELRCPDGCLPASRGAISAYHVSLRDGRLFVHGASSERGGRQR